MLAGTGFCGVSGSSGGNGGRDSATNYPVVQLCRIDNGQNSFLLSDPAVNATATTFTSVPVAAFSGHALVTVIANGIPGNAVAASYRTNTSPVGITGTIQVMDYRDLAPGDLAVTTSGVHVLA